MDRPSAVNLNAPCPCGSGRKYKRCCLARERQERASAARSVQQAGPALFAWAEKTFAAQLAACNTTYLGHVEKRFGVDKLSRFIARTESMVFTNLADVFVHEWEVRGKLTPADVYLAERGPRLHPRACAYLAAARKAALTLVEVEAVTPGESIVFSDLLSRRRLLVTEHSASRQVTRWEVMFARIAELDDENLLTGAIYPFDRGRLEWVLGTLRREKRRRGTTSMTWPAFLHRRWDIVPAIWFELHVDPLAHLQLANFDGELLRWVRLEFQLEGAFATEAATRLNAVEALRRDERDLWRWIDATGRGEDTVIATVALKGDVLEVNVNSLEREARVRARIEGALGPLVVAVRREETDVAEAMRRRGSAPGPRPEDDDAAAGAFPPEVAARIEREARARHYEKWPDIALPALDDMTPRQAAAEPALRPRLIRLLKTIEAHEQRADRAGTPNDLSFLWRELGIHRR